MKKITIAFPTFNRGLYLERAVVSIAEQVKNCHSHFDIELCVYDNSSTDETSKICERLQSEYDGIKVFRHDVNVGADRNILHALQQATGDYVWIFGDDDYILPGVLDSLLAVLQENDVSLLKMAGVEERDVRQGAASRVPMAQQARSLSQKRPVAASQYPFPDQILGAFGAGMGNFSSIVFSTKFLNSFYREPERVIFDSGYSQLEWMYRGIFEAPLKFFYVSEPCVSIRIEAIPRGLSSEKVVAGLNLLRNSISAIGYGEDVVEHFYKAQIEANRLGNLKACKFGEVSCLKAAMQALKEAQSVKLMAKVLVIALLPPSMYKSLWKRLG